MLVIVANESVPLCSLRFLDGAAEAASSTALLSILISMYPNHAASAMSYTGVLTGLGYMLGSTILLQSSIYTCYHTCLLFQHINLVKCFSTLRPCCGICALSPRWFPTSIYCSRISRPHVGYRFIVCDPKQLRQWYR